MGPKQRAVFGGGKKKHSSDGSETDEGGKGTVPSDSFASFFFMNL